MKKFNLTAAPSSEHRSLGGVADVIGNAALFAKAVLNLAYGTGEARENALGDMANATVLGLSGAVAAVYGQEAVPKQFTRLQRKLASHLELSGVKLEEAVRNEFQLNKPVGLKDKIEAFLYNHPAEIFTGVSGIAGLGYVVNNLIKSEKHRDYGDMAVGATLVAAALVANFMPEKTTGQIIREGKDPNSFMGKIAHRPLMLANSIAVTGNFAMAYTAGKDIIDASRSDLSIQANRHQLLLGATSAFSAAGFIAADFLMGTSSKKAAGSKEERHEAQDQMAISAAKLLAGQPVETHKPLAEAAAAYLTKQPELRMSDLDPAELTQKILDATAKAAEQIKVNQWAR